MTRRDSSSNSSNTAVAWSSLSKCSQRLVLELMHEAEAAMMMMVVVMMMIMIMTMIVIIDKFHLGRHMDTEMGTRYFLRCFVPLSAPLRHVTFFTLLWYLSSSLL